MKGEKGSKQKMRNYKFETAKAINTVRAWPSINSDKQKTKKKDTEDF